MRRSFGGSLDDTSTRLAVYREVLERAIRRCLVADGRCTSAAGGRLWDCCRIARAPVLDSRIGVWRDPVMASGREYLEYRPCELLARAARGCLFRLGRRLVRWLGPTAARGPRPAATSRASALAAGRRRGTELVRAARHWTGQYRDLDAWAEQSPERVLLAGHQPQMFHPGV